MLKLLDAELIDEQKIKHTNNYSEVLKLYKSNKSYTFANDSQGNQNVRLAWLEMICPSTGSTYMIEVCPSFNNALSAAKWIRPKVVPQSMKYNWISAN